MEGEAEDRKIYIKKDINKKLDNESFYKAYFGFKELGYEIILFTDIEEIKYDGIIVGYTQETRRHLDHLDKKYPELNYPNSLRKCLGRRLWAGQLKDVIQDESKWNVFIKSVLDGKVFPGYYHVNLLPI